MAFQYVSKDAWISPCGLYRLMLWRQWGEGPVAPAKTLGICGLNPSTADDQADDPTIVREVSFAKAWGYDALVKVNLFPFRATDPADMMAAADPLGPDADTILRAAFLYTDKLVAAWGVGGAYRGRGAAVRAMFPRLFHMGLTKDGHPRHPLYLRSDTQLTLWE